MFWECFEKTACETLPHGISALAANDGYTKESFVKTFTGIGLADKSQTLRMWRYLVRNYSESMLTRQTDRLVAISALASFFDLSLNPGDSNEGLESPSTYLAGLWGYDLIPQMLWEVLQLRSLPSPSSYIAPSWSWASLDCAVYHNSLSLFEDIQLATVKYASTTLANPNEPFGEVTDGRILLSGKLVQVTWTCRENFVEEPKTRDSSVIQIRVGETTYSHLSLDLPNWNVMPYGVKIPASEEVFYLLPLISTEPSKLNKVVADINCQNYKATAQRLEDQRRTREATNIHSGLVVLCLA
jgi:hypothetical protein